LETLRNGSEARLFAALFESAPVGIALLDRDGVIVDANSALAALLGCTADELDGQSFATLDTLYADGDGSGSHPVEPPSHDVERRYWRKDGAISFGRSSTWIIPGQFPARWYAIGMVEDITRRRAAEKKLRDQQTLAEIGKMAAIVAHQVKNPLAGIGGAVQIIRDRFPEGAGEREVLAEISHRLKQLDSRVDALVRYARASEPVFATLAIAETVEGVAKRLRSAFPQVAIAVDVDPDVTIEADQMMLDTLLDHLLRNAAEAMEGVGEIRVRLETDAMGLRLIVEDQGPGCGDPEMVFAPFFSTKPHGVGLGLAVARRVARAHRGDIVYEAGAEGARFIVHIPVKQPRS
jgi:PAS domain S-box-containing protein